MARRIRRWTAGASLRQLHDFLSTIQKKRHYHSQKVRLRRCGLSRPIYLVEGSVDTWAHVGERQRMRTELARIQMV